MPATDPIVQAVAEAMCPTHRDDVPPCYYCAIKAEAVVAAARPHIERETQQVQHQDVRELLEAVGLGGHARPYSMHEVIQREVLPAIRALAARLAAVEALADKWRNDEMPDPTSAWEDLRAVADRERETKAAALSLSLPRGLTWPTEQVREAVVKALTMTVEDLHVVIVGRDGAATAATSMGIDAEGFTDAVLAALAPHVAALVRAERAAALEDAAAWLHDLPWKPGPGQANRGPTDDPEEWMRGASDGVEWAVDRLTERADRIAADSENRKKPQETPIQPATPNKENNAS